VVDLGTLVWKDWASLETVDLALNQMVDLALQLAVDLALLGAGGGVFLIAHAEKLYM